MGVGFSEVAITHPLPNPPLEGEGIGFCDTARLARPSQRNGEERIELRAVAYHDFLLELRDSMIAL